MESTDLQRVNFEEGYVAVIDKPYRWSSTDVVRKVKFELRKAGYRRIKVGHAGTLDPLATGVLLVCIGRATKRVDALQAERKEYIAGVREAYTGPDADWSRPCYSPLFADLRGLPPTLVQVGTNEILKSDSERLVEHLQKAGVYAQLEVYPECWHVFQQMPIRRAAVAMESAGRFVQRII